MTTDLLLSVDGGAEPRSSGLQLPPSLPPPLPSLSGAWHVPAQGKAHRAVFVRFHYLRAILPSPDRHVTLTWD